MVDLTSILQVNTLEELKAIDTFKNIKLALKKELEGAIAFRSASWIDMFNSISAIKRLYKVTSEIEYFSSLECRYIFALVKLDKQERAELLNITLELYKNPDLAKEWYRNIIKLIHPDNSKHPLASKATEKLNELYDRMINHGKKD